MKHTKTTGNYHINITKFEIPQAIAHKDPVKSDWMIVVIHKFFYRSFQECKNKMKQSLVQVDAIPSPGVLARSVCIQGCARQ